MKTVFSRLWRKAFAVVALIPAWAAMPVQAAGPAFDNPLSESSVQATRDAVRSAIDAARALPTVPASAQAMPSAPASSGRGLPELAISNGDNVAGVLEYCVQSNVLNRASVDSVKATLLSHVGLNMAENVVGVGYRNGTAGLLMGVDGRTLDLRSAQPVLKEQACDYVLSNTKSLI